MNGLPLVDVSRGFPELDTGARRQAAADQDAAQEPVPRQQPRTKRSLARTRLVTRRYGGRNLACPPTSGTRSTLAPHPLAPYFSRWVGGLMLRAGKLPLTCGSSS
jgi:hypothetical protein